MKENKLKKLSSILIVTLLSILVFGCSKHHDIQEDSIKPEKVQLVVSLRLDQSFLKNTSTRASTPGEHMTEKECEINNLTLFVTKMTDGKEVPVSHVTLNHPDISQRLKFKMDFEPQTFRRFYLGANMNAEQIAAFSGENTIYKTTAPVNSDDFYSNAKFAMKIDPTTGAGSDIVMTARILMNGSPNIYIQKRDINLYEDIQLNRVVSKVLLTCAKDPLDGNYAKIADNIGGWVKFEDFHYILNTFDREFYLFPHEDDDPKLDSYEEKNLDPNYGMSSYIDKDSYNFINQDTYFSHFQRFEIEKLMEKLSQDKIEPYFKVKPTDSPNSQTEGLYCLENRVKKDISSASNPEKFFQMTKIVTTHIIAAAKYVPQKIYRLDSVHNKLELVNATNKEEILKELPEKTEKIGTETHVYPAGTFWYYRNKYFSMDAIKWYLEANPDASVSEVTRFDAGWGYYATYIDGSPHPDTHIVNYNDKISWGITRNNYYILQLKELTPPGSPIPGVKIMLLPNIEPWKNKDVNLDLEDK